MCMGTLSKYAGTTLKVLLQWKSTWVYTSWTYSTYHLEFALGTLMRHFVSACLVCHISWENICKFVFENSRFQLAEAFQSLLYDGRSALLTNRARAGQRLWYGIYFFEINRKRATGNSVMSMLLHWYCHIGFGCGNEMNTFTLKISTFLMTFTHATGPSHFVKAMQGHRSLWVINTVHKFGIHSVQPLLGHRMTWSSQIYVNTSWALSNEP